MTSPSPSAGAVLFVSDVPRVTTFYESIASMTLLHADADHAVLEVAGFQLTVHAMRWSEPAPALVDGRPPVREDSYQKLCFPVASLRRRVTSRCRSAAGCSPRSGSGRRGGSGRAMGRIRRGM